MNEELEKCIGEAIEISRNDFGEADLRDRLEKLAKRYSPLISAEARKQERERIKQWGEEDCSHREGWLYKRHCKKCWQSLWQEGETNEH